MRTPSKAARVLDKAVEHATFQGHHERHSIRRKSRPGELIQRLKAQYGDDVFADLKAEDIVEPSTWWLKLLVETSEA